MLVIFNYCLIKDSDGAIDIVIIYKQDSSNTSLIQIAYNHIGESKDIYGKLEDLQNKTNDVYIKTNNFFFIFKIIQGYFDFGIWLCSGQERTCFSSYSFWGFNTRRL